MKSSSNRRAFRCALLVLCGIGFFPGCKPKFPTRALPLSEALSSSRVVDFEGAGAAVTTVNPHLAEADVPGNVIQRPGVVSFSAGGTTLAIVSPGAAGTTGALTVSGHLTAARLQLGIPLDTLSPTGYYNASLFSGVKFYQKVSDGDDADPRLFTIPVAQTMPAPQGTCPTGCYNHFGYEYETTHGEWRQVVLPFASLTQQGGWGTEAVPSTFSGVHLRQVVQLQWQEDNPNTGTGGNAAVDFSIDEIVFF